MPGFLLHQNATVKCSHGGTATPIVPHPNVRVSGMPVTTLPRQWAVAGCGGPSPPGICVTAQFSTAATKVKVNLEPVLLVDSQSLTAAGGVPLLITSTQTKVAAT